MLNTLFVLPTILLMLTTTAKSDDGLELSVHRNLQKLVGTAQLYQEFEQSSCGELLDGELPALVKKIKTSLKSMEGDVKAVYPKIWDEVTAPNSKANRQAKKWVSHRIEKIPSLSSNKDFGCGVIYGEMLSFGYRFERDRVSLMVALKEAKARAENEEEQTKP